MKKKVLLLMPLFLVFCITQNVVAKKVIYLGHEYKGDVDKDKRPSGEGVMNVGGLIIEGIFHPHTVTMASVKITSDLGKQRTRFSGTVTYNESNNIVLKAGGTITTEYFESWDDVGKGNAKYVKESLKEDRVVNSDNFEPEELEFPFKYKLGEVFNEFNPPIVPAYYAIPLTRLGKNSTGGEQEVFIDLKKVRKLKTVVVKGLKDDQGRIWDYFENDSCYDFTVNYPNGSFYSERKVYSKRNEKGKGENVKYEIHYPDGKVLRFNENYYYDLGNGLYVSSKFDTDAIFVANDFLENLKKTTINVWTSGIAYSDQYDFSSLSSNEGDKIIKEHIIPFLENTDHSLSILESPRWADDSDALWLSQGIVNKAEATVGRFDFFEGKWKYMTKDDQIKAKEAEEAEKERAIKAKLAPYTRKFGFNPSDKSLKQLVTVGRSFSLLCDYFNDYYVQGSNCFFSFAEDTGISKAYRVVKNKKRVGHVYVQRDKIISVNWY